MCLQSLRWWSILNENVEDFRMIWKNCHSDKWRWWINDHSLIICCHFIFNWSTLVFLTSITSKTFGIIFMICGCITCWAVGNRKELKTNAAINQWWRFNSTSKDKEGKWFLTRVGKASSWSPNSKSCQNGQPVVQNWGWGFPLHQPYLEKDVANKTRWSGPWTMQLINIIQCSPPFWHILDTRQKG